MHEPGRAALSGSAQLLVPLRSILTCLQTLEAAIGHQTVGLVTRAEFAEKQRTLQEQIAAHQDKRKREELEAANKVIVTL